MSSVHQPREKKWHQCLIRCQACGWSQEYRSEHGIANRRKSGCPRCDKSALMGDVWAYTERAEWLNSWEDPFEEEQPEPKVADDEDPFDVIWKRLFPSKREKAFETLRLHTKTATRADIDSQYRRLATEFHPDRGGDVERFRQVQEAYEYLTR